MVRVVVLALAYVFFTIVYVPWLLGWFLGEYKERVYNPLYESEMFVGKPLLVMYSADDPMCEAWFIEVFMEKMTKLGQKVRCCGCCGCVW